jgi:hypothetical protein
LATSRRALADLERWAREADGAIWRAAAAI